MSTPAALLDRGQSVWLDYIRRNLLTSGDLDSLIEEGVRGITSNPSIFEKAIAGSDDYDAALKTLLEEDPTANSVALYEALAFDDIRQAADALRPLYEDTGGDDGYISLEVSPELAEDTNGTTAEARRLWQEVDRPNLMIKVPATPQGISAIEALIAEGINVNVTLIFSLDQYEQVASAYVRGVEANSEPGRVASVASFFVSRVDTAVDRELDATDSAEAPSLKGTIAVANAKLAFQRFQEIFGEDFSEAAARGARPQRVLWASTSTKNPAYSDLLYIEELVGPDTVNTVPPATLQAFRDHGEVRGDTLTEEIDEAEAALEALPRLEIDFDAIAERLLQEGVAAFADSFTKLLAALEMRKEAIVAGQVNRQELALGDYEDAVAATVARLQSDNYCHRLWAKDPTLWATSDTPEIVDRLGWLNLPELMQDQIDELIGFADEAREEGTSHVVLMGMGGSSLAPDVYQRTFGHADGYPELVVLDSTHPEAVADVDSRVAPQSTLFVVSSKSGTTLEPLSFFRYFWPRAAAETADPGQRFVAITDAGTPLADLAEEHAFRRVFPAPADVGGRYSALTHFGLVPAALIGADIGKLLDRAWTMSEAAAFCVPEPKNPALVLGAALGELARAGRDKATFLVSPSLAAFPDWLEQLVAESTGKNDTGIVPVVDEPVGTPEVYGPDRFFIYLSYAADEDSEQRRAVDDLEAAGHPVVRIRLDELEDLGQEIFRAETAVAAAGSLLGIHPFNQSDVQEAKELARRAMEGGPGDDDEVEEVSAARATDLASAVADWLRRGRSDDYVAIQAYLAPSPETTATLQRIRLRLRDRLQAATTLGYGPRFLHSTGQLHKGGPNTGMFLQLVDRPVGDIGVPGTDYSFGRLIAAQGLGDYRALIRRERRVLRVQLGSDAGKGLARLAEVIDV